MDRGTDSARDIAALHGLPRDPVEYVVGRGSVNHVVVVGAGADRWVIRFARDPDRVDEFATEHWCAQQAAANGIPTPEVLTHGVLDGVSYGIQRYVHGPPGDRVTHPDLWATLGRYGVAVNRIQPDDSALPGLFSRFGRDLEQAWQAHVGYNIDCLHADDTLLRLGAYSVAQQRRLRQTLTELRQVPMRFGLSHGDLTTRNLLVPAAGPPVLIDWGSASFGPVPYTDLLAVDRDARRIGSPAAHELRTFTEEVGLEPDEVATTFAAFRQLQLHDLARWALDHRPDRVEAAVDDLAASLGQQLPSR